MATSQNLPEDPSPRSGTPPRVPTPRMEATESLLADLGLGDYDVDPVEKRGSSVSEASSKRRGVLPELMQGAPSALNDKSLQPGNAVIDVDGRRRSFQNDPISRRRGSAQSGASGSHQGHDTPNFVKHTENTLPPPPQAGYSQSSQASTTYHSPPRPSHPSQAPHPQDSYALGQGQFPPPPHHPNANYGGQYGGYVPGPPGPGANQQYHHPGAQPYGYPAPPRPQYGRPYMPQHPHQQYAPPPQYGPPQGYGPRPMRPPPGGPGMYGPPTMRPMPMRPDPYGAPSLAPPGTFERRRLSDQSLAGTDTLAPPSGTISQRRGSAPDLNEATANSDAMSTASGGTTAIAAAPSLVGASGEVLETYRQNAKRSTDPTVQLSFAKQLIAAGEALTNADGDPKKNRKQQEALYAEALKWIKKLATNGGIGGKSSYPEAQFFLAECYGNGSLHLPVDHDKAFSLYVQASKQAHPAATYRTAVCYEVGAGTKRDSARAMQFYRKAAALGDTAAMYKVGMIMFNGLFNQSKNPREGVTWLKRAAAQADENTPHALHELGVLYEGGAGEGVVIPDPQHAHELFLRAAQLGYPPSQFKLGFSYEYGLLSLPIDPRRSIAWYTRAAEQSDPDAELALSGWYLTGAEGVLRQSDTEAYLWARKAADKGLAKAEYAVGWYSENGVGIKPDLEEARRWYLRAAAQGNKRAVARVKELKNMMYATQRGTSSAHSVASAAHHHPQMGGSMRGPGPAGAGHSRSAGDVSNNANHRMSRMGETANQWRKEAAKGGDAAAKNSECAIM